MIPRIAHFIWLGRNFPWIFTLGIKSAAARGGFERVIFHHTDDLGHLPWGQELLTFPGVEGRRLNPTEALEETGPPAARLIDRYLNLPNRVAKSNLLRMALLWRHGGVYLDTDTLTIATLSPLFSSGVFCGEEHIVYPYGQKILPRKSMVRRKAAILSSLRKVLQMFPQGFRLFQMLRFLYSRAVNGAVLGGQPSHRFFGELMARMADLPEEVALRPHALGTHLLQQAVKEYQGRDLAIHSPEVFYPLGPVISRHWFRKTRFPNPQRVISPRTKVVHWYSSNWGQDLIDMAGPDWIRVNAGSQLFSALALPLLE
jgi:hypothetical protein